ncbi:TPA: DUF4838 domain-containing protein [Candidatus Poribacteria bacterium]|nr:DUF4838 domain-containing protein [Candidatus Poribacteria bacterium]
MVLVEQHKPQTTIVVANEPSEQAEEAACILQDYIEKISDARVEIKKESEDVSGNTILVGHSQMVKDSSIEVPSGVTFQLNEEGFVIKIVGNSLILAGNEDGEYRGTVYAVYTFLEELGCRWFFPGEFGEVIPEMDTISINAMDRTERPSFRIRNIWYSGWAPTTDQDHQDFRLWRDCNKLNTLSLSIPGDGSIRRLVPSEEYFESSPHLFAINKDGDRRSDMLCLSEPETVNISVKTIKDTFRDNPDTLSFGFAPPDGFPMCYCQRCQDSIPEFNHKGYGDPSLSDLWFRFANCIAQEVYKEFPDRWVLTNGYANRVRLPEGIAEFSPNLGIQSAIIAACTLHPVGDKKCWQRTLYKQLLDRWTDTLNCVFVYDYDPGNSLVNLPFPAIHNLKHDMPYFRSRGTWGFWTEGTNSWMVTHLNYYVRAKLMWDAEADVEALVRDYCQKFYADAADMVEEYIWTLESAVEQTASHQTWGRLMQWRTIFPPVQQKLDYLMSQAEDSVQDSCSRQRVQVLRLVHNHMKAYVRMEQFAAQGQFQVGLEWADKMLAIRDEVNIIKSGLLPHTPEWAHDFRTTLEWHKEIYQDLADKAGGQEGELLTLLPRQWEFKLDPKDVGVIYQWYLDGRGEDWATIDTTLNWEGQGYQDQQGWGFWGKAWYRTGFHVPADIEEGKSIWLTIGAVYNRGVWVWFNGMMQQFEKDRHWRLGHHDVRTPIHIDVTDWARSGEINHVAVLVNTTPPDRNPRGGIHRRSFLWTPR